VLQDKHGPKCSHTLLTPHSGLLLSHAPVNLRASPTKCERSEHPQIARQVQRTLGDTFVQACCTDPQMGSGFGGLGQLRTYLRPIFNHRRRRELVRVSTAADEGASGHERTTTHADKTEY
jgi:hypothetical protein